MSLVAALVAPCLVLPLLTATPASAASPGGGVRVSSQYLLCIPGVDAPTPNRTYPYAFLLGTRLADTADKNIRASVKDVQAVLRNEGYRGKNGKRVRVDGSYGTQTRYAVKQFQLDHRLGADGKVGSQTWRKLASKCWKFH